MVFAAPLWLLALAPWAVLTVWMFLRRRTTTAVPFLQFWPATTATSSKSPKWHVPPAYLILILLAVAAALIGAARPQWIFAPTRLPPKPPASQAQLIYLAAADRPHAEVMLRILTRRFEQNAVDVTVQSGEGKTSQHVMVTPGGTSTAFVDLPSLASTVTASIPGGPPLSIRRSGEAIALAPNSSVPPALQKMIDVYQKQTPGDDRVTTPIVVGTSFDESRSGIILPPSTADSSAPLIVMDDPITRDVDWAKLQGGCTLPADWTPLVSRGRSVIVGRRKGSTTQIAVSIGNADWPKEPSFVVFWSNVLREFAGGEGGFTPVAVDPQPESAGPSKSIEPTWRDLSPAMFFGAMALLLAAVLVVPRTAISYTAAHAHEASNPHR